MPNLKSKGIFIVILLFSWACTAQKESAESSSQTSRVQEGFQLTSIGDLPFDSGLTTSVAKVFYGNSFIGSGAFISENGLLLTNYEPVLAFVSQSPEHQELLEGYSAVNQDQEIPLNGVSVLVLIEERDVTEIINQQIPENSNNTVIARLKQQATQNLIQEEKGHSPDIIVQVSDLYSRNRQVLSKYQLFTNVRLVWNESLSIPKNRLTDSDAVLDESDVSTSLLRVYSESGDFNSEMAPLEVAMPFNLASTISLNSETIALGFPETTFRSESMRALNFYNTVTNPAIINSYQPHKAILEEIASTSDELAITTLYNRIKTANQIKRYLNIQSTLTDAPFLKKKSDEIEKFRVWLDTDTTISPSYKGIFSFVNQAYDIAEQNGASFFNISYSNQLMQIDDLAEQVKNFFEQAAQATSDEDVSALKEMTLQNMTRIRSSINIDIDLAYLSSTIETLQQLPDAQQIPSLDGIITESDQSSKKQIDNFLERQKSKTFLFNAEATLEAIDEQTMYQDSLFTILDELLFVNDMNRNNHGIFLAYLQPAQQVYTKAFLEFRGQDSFQPEANGTLRYNVGNFGNTESNSFIITMNDFSANAKGSAVFTNERNLIGLVTNYSDNISTNYIFEPQKAYLKSVSIPNLYREWKMNHSNSIWFDELIIGN